jgi:tRNA(His) guanylyltransferase
MTSLGDRMKNNYEKAYRYKVPARIPMVVRVDGKAFHTLTRRIKAKKPFDGTLMMAMNITAEQMLMEMSNCKFAYVQSDEISFLFVDYFDINTQPWFGNNIQKIASVTAGMASSKMSRILDTEAVFDSRVFVLPPWEVNNYFIWRQQDWMRNSLQMVARSHFSHNQLNGKNRAEVDKMLFDIGVNYNDLHSTLKYGRYVTKGGTRLNSEKFSENRRIVEQFIPEIARKEAAE